MIFCKKQYQKLLKYLQQLEKAKKSLSSICKSNYRELFLTLPKPVRKSNGNREIIMQN